MWTGIDESNLHIQPMSYHSYLLTGNKVPLYFTEMNSYYLVPPEQCIFQFYNNTYIVVLHLCCSNTFTSVL